MTQEIFPEMVDKIFFHYDLKIRRPNNYKYLYEIYKFSTLIINSTSAYFPEATIFAVYHW